MRSRDPYRNFKFTLESDGIVTGGFQKVTGLKHTIEVIDYREGGENEIIHKLPGQSSFGEVTLERGVSDNEDFLKWMAMIFQTDTDGVNPAEDGWRKDLVLKLRNKSGETVRTWTILQCWPSERTLGDFDATGNDVLIETLVLQNEGVKEKASNPQQA